MTIQFGRWAIGGRPALIGLAGLSAVIGGFAIVRAAQNVWAVDAHRNLAAAVALQNGTFGSVPDYLYSPLAAALTVPALALPTDVAVVAWLAIKIVLLAVGTAIATRGLDRVDRWLLGVVVVGFLPILYDLELGNVTVLVLVAVAAIAWTPDQIATGIPLGLILATAPKPQLIPVLVWLVVAHRRALGGAFLAAVLSTLIGLALTGEAAYREWVDALRAPAYLNSGEIINLALWSLPPVVARPRWGCGHRRLCRRASTRLLARPCGRDMPRAPAGPIHADLRGGFAARNSVGDGSGVDPRGARARHHGARRPRACIPRMGWSRARHDRARARGGVAAAVPLATGSPTAPALVD